jgi:hypothetical protein
LLQRRLGALVTSPPFDRLGRDADVTDFPVDQRLDPLEIRLEAPLGNGGDMGADAALFLGFAAAPTLSLLQLVDLIVAKLPPRHSAIMDMVYLRDRVAEVEEMNDQARQTIEKLDAVVEKLRSPAFRVGTFLMPVEPDKAHVCAGGTDYVCRIDPQFRWPACKWASACCSTKLSPSCRAGL